MRLTIWERIRWWYYRKHARGFVTYYRRYSK